ncbi:putative proline-betaine transporter [Bifidobacterium actinocoloniiforme DSM 22766]|uniref:Putative proline/betaine transporter n=1 Tax=Bifidobacterium actinocoloniiforme DSM 22766 TaxID=1437605 RepID=A0A086Z2H8_9BIFI|nr:MFS transporter [Bifidobacterium actinocoloniiforme]KFI40728.1 putative proline-betaine transporter [Bifidobacterium actinocoloniiforme DSM 22766]
MTAENTTNTHMNTSREDGAKPNSPAAEADGEPDSKGGMPRKPKKQTPYSFRNWRRRLHVSDVTVVEKATLKRAVAGTVVGNFMEWYDVGVYGYLAITIGVVFLSDASPAIQRLFSLGVFAVTFIARPLGGIVLGQLGDKLGRQRILAFTLLSMSGATLLIGLLPGYSAIGFWAPLALIILKLAQGFSTGGEYAGATTMVTEYAPDRHRGFFASLLDVGSYLGFAFGAGLVSLIEFNLSPEAMQAWGWRIPFILALPLAAIAVYFRTRVEDTPAFQQAQNATTEKTAAEHKGVISLIRGYWRELLMAFVLVAAANTLGYTLTTYMPTYLTTTLHQNMAQSNLLTLPILLIVAACIPLTGALSDKFGRKKILFAGALTGLALVIPAFELMEQGTAGTTFLGLLLIAIPVIFFVANLASSLPALFPTASRYGGMGLSYNLAVAIFGGTAPLIMEALVSATGRDLAPAYWIMFTSACGLVTVLFLKESARKPMPGTLPTVSSQQEARDLVATQDKNPDLDVKAIIKDAEANGTRQVPETIKTAARAIRETQQM